jgi:hypothetical protein
MVAALRSSASTVTSDSKLRLGLVGFWVAPLAMTIPINRILETARVRPSERFSVVAPYGPCFTRPAKTPVTERPERLQGRFKITGT